jgi:hypothetical protein
VADSGTHPAGLRGMNAALQVLPVAAEEQLARFIFQRSASARRRFKT